MKITLNKGYAVVTRTWKKGDTVELILPMAVRRVAAHAKVAEDRGKIALERGPLVYCLESIDNEEDIMARQLPDNASLQGEKT